MLEKQFHSLPWNSSIKPYSELKEVFKGIGFERNNIFVKGSEKEKFISNLLSDFNNGFEY